MSDGKPVSGRRAAPPAYFYAVSLLIGLLVPLLALEVALRFMPVQDIAQHTEIDRRWHVNRFRPGDTMVWSNDWRFSESSIKKANNAGYLSDYDYTPVPGKPVMGVVGDSFVEALQVPNEDTFHALLGRAVAGSGGVYAVGQSGASLADYLGYARMLTRTYTPAALVFTIFSNDYDESSCDYVFAKGAKWCFREDPGNGQLVLTPYPAPERGWLRTTLARSALWRYVSYNLGANPQRLRQQLVALMSDAPQWSGNVAMQVSPERWHRAEQSVTAFLDQLPAITGLPADRILFVVEGVSDNIYGDEASLATSYAGRIRSRFLAEAARRGYEAVDMQPVQREHFASTGERMHVPSDGHWNRIGHRLIAQSIAGSSVYARVFPALVASGPAPAPPGPANINDRQ